MEAGSGRDDALPALILSFPFLSYIPLDVSADVSRVQYPVHIKLHKVKRERKQRAGSGSHCAVSYALASAVISGASSRPRAGGRIPTPRTTGLFSTATNNPQQPEPKHLLARHPRPRRSEARSKVLMRYEKALLMITEYYTLVHTAGAGLRRRGGADGAGNMCRARSPASAIPSDTAAAEQSGGERRYRCVESGRTPSLLRRDALFGLARLGPGPITMTSTHTLTTRADSRLLAS